MPGPNTFLRHANHKPWFSPATLFGLGFFLFLTGSFIDELAFLLILAQILFIVNLTYSSVKGDKVKSV